MPNYISLCRWTASGTEKLKDSPARLDAARKTLADNGVKLLSFYMTMGKYDMVIIVDAPSDEVLAKAMLPILAGGKLVMQTSRAFDEAEYRQILGSLA
jgi:uncharacterized protein with GYD domain